MRTASRYTCVENGDFQVFFNSFIIVFLKSQTIVLNRELSTLSVKVNLYLFSCKLKKLLANGDNLQPAPGFSFSSHKTSLLVLSLCFYTSNQFSDFNLFICFWKSLIKIRNILLILFCRYICLCCHHLPLLNFIGKH